MTQPETKLEFDIAAQELKKTYGNFDAIRGIDLSIKSGEFFTLFGPNGAGKTTLIKLFCYSNRSNIWQLNDTRV